MVSLARPSNGKAAVASIPWIESYRPRRLNEVLGLGPLLPLLQYAVATHDLPHLLLCGPPGVGKTSCVQALCADLYGSGSGSNAVAFDKSSCVLEVNASEERGIQAVRDRIKSFVRLALPAGARFQLVIMDEADSLTGDAQTALRRIMEAHAARTRFVFLCNYDSRIIAPIVSRCLRLRFLPVDDAVMRSCCRRIAAEHKLDVTDADLQLLVRSNRGDLRGAIGTLQLLADAQLTIQELGMDSLERAHALWLRTFAGLDAPRPSASALERKTTATATASAAVTALIRECHQAACCWSDIVEHWMQLALQERLSAPAAASAPDSPSSPSSLSFQSFQSFQSWCWWTAMRLMAQCHDALLQGAHSWTQVHCLLVALRAMCIESGIHM